MQLIACHIDNFGKLSNLDLNFHEGTNTITGPNGWGKSTLAAFFKAMLYGFDNKREEGAWEKERKIYEPWQGGLYGGTLDFQTGNKRYRILRTFGQTEKGDRFQLMDLDTGAESTDFSSRVGTELFDLDRNSFKKSVYIAQNDCIGGTTDTINAKLGNLAANARDIDNFENAMQILRTRMNRMSPNRSTGSLKRRKNTITELEQEVRGLESAESASDRLQAKLQQKEGMMQEMTSLRREYTKVLQTASEDSRREEARRQYELLCEDVKDKNAALDVYRKIFPHGVPTEESFVKCQNAINQLEEQQTTVRNMQPEAGEEEELKKLQEIFNDSVPSDEVLDDMLEKAVNVSRMNELLQKTETELARMENKALEQKNRLNSPVPLSGSSLFPVGIVIFCLGLAAFAGLILEHFLLNAETGALLSQVTLATGLVLLLAGTILINLGARKNNSTKAEAARQELESTRRQKEIEAPIKELQSELEADRETMKKAREDLEFYLHSYPGLDSSAPYQEQIYELKAKKRSYQYLKGKNDIYRDAAQQCAYLEKKLRHFANLLDIPYGNDIQLRLNGLQSRAAECYMAKDAAETAMRRKHRFEAEHDVAALNSAAKCPYTLDELNEMISQADEGMEHLRASVTQYRRQIDDLQEQLDLRDEKEQELYRERNAQEEEAADYEICSLTRDYLQAARDKFVGRYMGPVTDSFRKYYAILSGEYSDNWMIDTNMNLRLQEQGQMRETKWLSAGWQDLLGICMRLALADAMYPQEKPFLILDDPFVNLDDEKLANGKRFLEAVSGEYQTIYFTCHESRQ